VKPRAAPARYAYHAVQAHRRLRLQLAHAGRSLGHRGTHDAVVPRRRHPRRGQEDVRLQPGLPGHTLQSNGAVRHRRAVAGRPRRPGQRLGPAQQAAPLRRYAAPDVLLIDEVGYLSCSNLHTDLLFEFVSRRYQHKSTVVTTNKAFADWGEVFPNAACVVSLVDRLMHRAEVVRIEGESYRAKEAQERLAARAKQRSTKSGRSKP